MNKPIKLIDADALVSEIREKKTGYNAVALAMILSAPDASEPLRARIVELEGLVSQTIDGLSRMIGDGICLQDGGGFFVPMYDPDGEYLGEQQIDPQHVAIMGFSMASDLLNMLKGGKDE